MSNRKAKIKKKSPKDRKTPPNQFPVWLIDKVAENAPRDSNGDKLTYATRNYRVGVEMLLTDPKFAKACGKMLYEMGHVAFEKSYVPNPKGFADAVFAEYKNFRG